MRHSRNLQPQFTVQYTASKAGAYLSYQSHKCENKMEVKIKLIHENDILTYNLDPKSTILNLKEKIAEEEGSEIDRQRLFYNFVLLSDETILEELGDATFYLSLPTAGAHKVKIESSQETFIIVGTTSNFKIFPILPNVCETIKAGKFAVVRNQENQENGLVYYARRYTVKNDCQIKCQNGKVFEIQENGVEVELEGELKIFQSGKNVGKLKKVGELLNLGANAANLIASVTEFALSLASCVA